jgi:hypothetical protein
MKKPRKNENDKNLSNIPPVSGSGENLKRKKLKTKRNGRS